MLQVVRYPYGQDDDGTQHNLQSYAHHGHPGSAKAALKYSAVPTMAITHPTGPVAVPTAMMVRTAPVPMLTAQ